MIFRESKIIFLHIPKTGGTTIEKVICPNQSLNIKPNYLTLYGWDDQYGWLNHLTLDQIIKIYPNLDLNEYAAFMVVRNPWDRLVSEYHWKSSISGLQIPFIEYVRLLYIGETKVIQKYYKSPMAFEQHIQPQSKYILHSNKVVVKILRFENFERELIDTLKKYGVKINSLPKTRTSIHAHYTYYYNRFTYNMVGNLYIDDIIRFGYNFV